MVLLVRGLAMVSLMICFLVTRNALGVIIPVDEGTATTTTSTKAITTTEASIITEAETVLESTTTQNATTAEPVTTEAPIASTYYAAASPLDVNIPVDEETVTTAPTLTKAITTTEASIITEAETIFESTTTQDATTAEPITTETSTTAASTYYPATSDDSICYTRECLKASYHILHSVDQTVDPCDDFYQFSCGNFLKYAFASNQLSIHEVMNDRKEEALENIVIDELESEDNLTMSYRNQRKYYRACMNTSAIEKDQDRTFLAVLKELTGGWPLSPSYNKNLHWQEIMIKAREKGLKFNYFLSVDITDSTESPIYLNVTLPPRSNFEEHLWEEANVHKIMKMSDYWNDVTFGGISEVRKTIEFVKKLKEIVEKAQKIIGLKYFYSRKRTTILSLNKPPSFDWLQFLKNLTNQQQLRSHDVSYFGPGRKEYLENLDLLIQTTETRIWVNYIVLLLISENNIFLSKKIRNTYSDILNSTIRIYFCFDKSIEMFNGVAEAEYIRKMMTDDKRKHIRGMIENIKTKFDEALKKNTWMDEQTKRKASKVLKNVTEFIGWTDITFNATEFEKILGFDKLNFESDNIIKMNQQLVKHFYDSRFNRIRTDLSTSFESMYRPLLEVNAFYAKYYNLIVLLAAYLQLPIHDQNQPEYINYGALGSIFSHELTHAMSNLPDTQFFDYWTYRTHIQFRNAAQCINNEYNKYTEKLNVSSAKKTSVENMADFTALNLAYQAYQKWVELHGTEKQLPGLKYSPNQLFWIMTGTYQCIEPKGGWWVDGRDSHAVASFRVVGPMRNSPYFGKDFGCSEGRRMNPKEKCRLFV